jgi:carbamoyl-phosphate synthase large subunit
MTPVNLLLVSAGRRVELVRLFRHAYQQLGLEGRILAVDLDPLAPALREADAWDLVPRVDDPGFIDALVEICRRGSVSLVFPLIDPAIPVLARHRQELEATGARLAVVSAAAADIARDKWRTHEWLKEHGLPTPETWLAESLPARPPFPLFVKPRAGSAGRGAFRADSPDELAFFVGHVQDPIVQPFLEGPEITNDVFASLRGELWSIVSRRRIEVRWGEVHKGVTVHSPEILEGVKAIAAALQPVGPITVQCLLDGGRPMFTEINARFAGGMPLAVAAGVPAPLWYLQEAAGWPVEPPPLGRYQADVYLTRYDESIFIEGDPGAALAGGRVRSG